MTVVALPARLRARKTLLLAAASLVLVAWTALVVLPASAATTLLSQGRPATASSSENAAFPATAAVDGNAGTRWSSAFSDPQWIQVDLGAPATISQVVLQWETAAGKAFQIQTSNDAASWTSIYSTTTGAGGTQTLNVSGTGRYVRMYGTARTTAYGYSLWEFQVYGSGGTTPTSAPPTTPNTSPGSCGTTNAALYGTATASSAENDGSSAAAAIDDNTGSRWSSLFSDPQWIQVDLGASLPVCQVKLQWEAAYATAFQIQLSANASAWTTVYSTTTGTGGTQTIPVSGSARYVRMYGTARATGYGYSLWEFGVYTVGGVVATPTPTPTQPAPGNCPWVNSSASTASKVSQLLGQMSLTQKTMILHGTNPTKTYIGEVVGIPSLCIPTINFQDGPSGVGDGLGGVTQMPDGVTTAATFDSAYAKLYGQTIGAEFAAKGVNVALGPTINMIRDPRWGRSFETYGEDPYLAGQMAAGDVQGIQSQGVMAQVKHAAAYNIEQPAGTIIVDRRTLQEIYLPAFQTAITQGNAASVMCGYSNVNNVPACQNPQLLNIPLYQQAGFTGFVGSDWGGAHSTVESANAGMTMEMPGGYFYADFLAQAVQNGQVSQATLDTMVTRVLTKMFDFGMFNKAPSGSSTATVTSYAHQQVAVQGATEGTVLLKNNGVLPLSTASGSSIAVIGVDAGAGTQTIGGGSGTVTSSGTTWPITGIQNRVAGTGVTVTYNEGTDQNAAATLARNSTVAVVFASDNYGHEEGDNTSLNLPNNQDALIAAVAAANPRTVVVLNNNAAILMPWLNQVAGVFEGFYDGQGWGKAIAALLFGDANPSGHLPISFPTALSNMPTSTAAQWPGVNGQVQYSEGMQIGYRWYDAHNVAPLFPFGFGLSYTTFGFSNLHVNAISGNQATVTATVTNTGSRAGTEVAQLYVGHPAANGEPPHQLQGFQRITLNPGASGTVTFTLPMRAFAHWDDASQTWIASAGSYQILVGDSSRNLPLTGTETVATTVTVPLH
ncbi:discoidin domain-containing protein [Dactylosporangium sp. CA-139066]|uniref:discoidin domain-containing protein n=1 Tax=Dactylosporangium sp. CA-139066 TaxID=3239930 RepID=UPI003D8C6AC6